MYLRLMGIKWPKPKLAHLTMPVLKFGGISCMIPKVIFGHLDVSFIKWPR